MNIEEIIKEGESFKIDAELDYSGEATWINDSKLNEYHQWVHKTLLYLRDNFSDNATCIDFSNLSKKYANTNNIEVLDKQLNLLKALLSYLNEKQYQKLDDNFIIESIFNNFNDFIRHSSKRYNNRDAFFIINDEYDIQDILHSIFKLFYKDIEKEFVIPKFAGSSTRIDFILKNEQIGIEVKMTREGLKDKQLCEQLLLDIDRYFTLQTLKVLYCFIYDPDKRIGEPYLVKRDLEKKSNKENVVKVFICQ